MFTETNVNDLEHARTQNALYQLRMARKTQKVDDERIEQLLSLINGLVDSLPFSRRTREVKNKRGVIAGYRPIALGPKLEKFNNGLENSIEKPQSSVSKIIEFVLLGLVLCNYIILVY